MESKPNTLVINLFGGPGVGKSTLAAELFVMLKKQGASCELVSEYAKDKVWENSLDVLTNQIYVFGKQHQKLFRVLNKVQIVIMDSPLLLSIVYDQTKNPYLANLILTEHNALNNLNIILPRCFEYSQDGRYQDEDGAIDKDRDVEILLEALKVPCVKMTPEERCGGVDILVPHITNAMREMILTI